MKITTLLLFCLTLLTLLGGKICDVWAKAPKRAKIAFSSNRRGNWDIYLMNTDGSQQVNLTRHPADEFSPVWSPTGEHILFRADRDGVDDLYLMDADGKNVRKVFRTSARRIEPAWAPDGSRIAYHTDTPKWSIKVGIIEIGAEKQIVSADQRGGNPSWSPDGNEIAFVTDLGGSRRIRIINLRTNEEVTFLPKQSSWMYTPAWGPEGDKIAFSWYKWGDGRQAIFVANRDGSGLKQVVKPTERTTGPAWSPSGDELLYTEEVGGQLQIFKIALNRRAKRQLTRKGDNITAAWFDPAFAELPVAPQPQLLTTVWGKIKAD